MEKRCLIIDNEEQVSNIETIERLGRAKGLKIICDEFNVGMLSKDELLTENKIDITKVVDQYNKEFKGNTYHLVALDWDLGDAEITGVELIRKFQEYKILVNTPKILYSGLLKDEISSKLERFKNNDISKTFLINWINTLIKVDIKNFVDRVAYEQEIITQLLKNDETLDLIIEEELMKFPDLKFSNSFTSKSFKGKSFLDIGIILKENPFLRNEFKKEIIQQVISYLTEKIQDVG
jgi:hypothetical protein